MTTFVESYPHPFHPVILDENGYPVADTSRTVEVFQLRNGDQQRLADWAGAVGYPGVDGGVLLLVGGAPLAPDGGEGPQIRLGDFVVRDGATVSAVAAEVGFFQLFTPA